MINNSTIKAEKQQIALPGKTQTNDKTPKPALY